MRRSIAIGCAALLSLSSVCAALIMVRPGRFGGPGAGPLTQQIEAIAATVDESQPNALALRDTAEENLVQLGADAVEPIRDAVQRHPGLAGDALLVAAFRLENDLTPQDLITAWARKKTDKQIAAKAQHIVGEELLRAFPHHLFYCVTLADAKSVVALAADGMVQDLSDDTALAKFLKNELSSEKSSPARGHAATAALLLAAARTGIQLKPDDITKDTPDHAATASITLPNQNLRVDLSFAADGTVTTVKTTTEKIATTTPAPATQNNGNQNQSTAPQ